MNDDRAMFRIGRGVELMQVLCTLDRVAARHGEVIETGVEIGGKHFAKLFDDRYVGVRKIKAKDGFKADRFEITLFLRLLQGISISSLPNATSNC
jgi:hypothetical protein